MSAAEASSAVTTLKPTEFQTLMRLVRKPVPPAWEEYFRMLIIADLTSAGLKQEESNGMRAGLIDHQMARTDVHIGQWQKERLGFFAKKIVLSNLRALKHFRAKADAMIDIHNRIGVTDGYLMPIDRRKKARGLAPWTDTKFDNIPQKQLRHAFRNILLVGCIVKHFRSAAHQSRVKNGVISLAFDNMVQINDTSREVNGNLVKYLNVDKPTALRIFANYRRVAHYCFAVYLLKLHPVQLLLHGKRNSWIIDYIRRAAAVRIWMINQVPAIDLGSDDFTLRAALRFAYSCPSYLTANKVTRAAPFPVPKRAAGIVNSKS